MSLSSTSTIPQVHYQRICDYLSACNIPVEKQSEIIKRTLAKRKENESLEQTLSSLQQFMWPTTAEQQHNNIKHRLSLFLDQDTPEVSKHRGWSMPPISRSRMVPKDHTPRIIKAIRRLSFKIS